MAQPAALASLLRRGRTGLCRLAPDVPTQPSRPAGPPIVRAQWAPIEYHRKSLQNLQEAMKRTRRWEPPIAAAAAAPAAGALWTLVGDLPT